MDMFRTLSIAVRAIAARDYVDDLGGDMSTDWKIACTAIVGITVMEVMALSQGVDGLLMGFAIGACSGIGGFVMGLGWFVRKENNKNKEGD